ALQEKYTNLKLVDEIPKEPPEMLLTAFGVQDVQHNYAPPTVESLQFFGRGISQKQMQALQKTKEVLILDFAHPKNKVWDALHAADGLVEDIARKTGGLVWDEDTREVFSPDAWHAKRLQSWDSNVPDISTQTMIQSYRKGESNRAITRGMAKAGLPDVIVRDFPETYGNSVGGLINLFCQSMAEGARFDNPGTFKLDLRAIQNTKVRDSRMASLKSNATALACLSLKPGVPEEGNPDNRLVELTPDKYPGPDTPAKQQQMLGSFYGWEDSIIPVEDDEESLAASRKAREKLPELRQAFSKGLQPGELIQVQAPFATPDGDSEGMWVEVTSWKGNKIKGLLQNAPFNVPTLHPGQMVEVREEDVYDYLHKYPDNHTEGNTTSEILSRKQKEKDGNTGVASPNVNSPQQTVPACD